MVNENRTNSGLWRLRDTKGNDQFDDVKFLREAKGSGEHGTHALMLGPDGKSIYFTNGNHTPLPANMEKSRPVAWGEDHLLPRMWDARGHAKGILAPGGYIARTDPDGKSIELFAMGFRNTYDFAFDQNGELFTYDSDMEWDQGSPWYVPTRIHHVTDGGDFGWRSGAGRWPAYYADSLPAILDIGPGCPTGVTFGTGAKFPAKYQRAFFASDWTYGTMYAIHLTPDGSTFKAEKEEFVSGKPLPLTDVVINPHDGAMYFTVGGRRTQSALYRVT
jgi:glucose/arabinose dehydrogenase